MSTKDTTIREIPGEGFVLRPAADSELNGLGVRLAGDPNVSPWWGDDPHMHMPWFREEDTHVFVIQVDGTEAGLITFTENTDPDYRCAGLDIAMFSGCAGRGVGTAALRTLCRWLYDERGHHRLTIDPAVANERAIHVYRKVGFKDIGVARDYERSNDGSWHNGLLMDMLPGDMTD